MPELSIVVPTLDEAERIGRLLDDLASLTRPHEVVVADGGSGDGTARIAAARGARVVVTGPGRGLQLAAGAETARAEILCFLHADVRLPPESVRVLDSLVMAPGSAAHAFRLRIDGARRAFRLVETTANLRSRLLRLPYGDQGLVVSRAAYERAGGYPPIPLMEDVALVLALCKIGDVRVLPAEVRVSPRRWERDGVLRRSVRNVWLLLRFLAGADPAVLARVYADGG